MRAWRNVAAIALCGVLVAACATYDSGGVPTGQNERRAAYLRDNARHGEAASVYIGLAADASGAERDRLTLLAVEQWLDAGDGRRARTALSGVPTPDSGQLLWLWSSNAAALALWEGQPDRALRLLEPLSQQPLPLRLRIRVEALRGDTWFQKQEPIRAVDLYVQRENWLARPEEIEANRRRLWAGLKVSDPQVMRAAADRTQDPLIEGWLTLGALATSTGQQGIGWANGAVRWRDTHPGHPAMDILSGLDVPEVAVTDYPRRLALLLPLSGNNAAAARAIKNGFLGAYFAAATGLDNLQQIRIYDVNQPGGVGRAYNRAVEDGAEFVVGPLIRESVEDLASERLLPVSILSLNYLPDDVAAPPGFYQFALAPEDEAAAAATRARADGMTRAVALVPRDEWGQRVLSSFATEFEARGGVLLDYTTYDRLMQDFSPEIEDLMALSQSVQRYRRLRANIGEALQFDPRRRQDVEFVFLGAEAKPGRLIKSQLKFHYSGELPVYSTSVIYSMDGRSDSDLNGLMFPDTPWIVSPPAWIENYPTLYGEFWPAEKRLGRLHAMGYDAYHLVTALYAPRTGPIDEIVGATGRLWLDADGRVHRKLAWARFENGRPEPLPDIEYPGDETGDIVPDSLSYRDPWRRPEQ